MNWKKFFSPTSGKVMIFCTFMAIGSLLWYLTHIGVTDPTNKAGIIFAYLFNAVAPFYTYPSGWLWNILYFYTISCIFSYSYHKTKKDTRRVQNIGIGVLLIMMCFGVVSFHQWNNSYVIESPGIVIDAPQDYENLQEARVFMDNGDWTSAEDSCSQIEDEEIRSICNEEIGRGER